jgi:hypothetical protein
MEIKDALQIWEISKFFVIDMELHTLLKYLKILISTCVF